MNIKYYCNTRTTTDASWYDGCHWLYQSGIPVINPIADLIKQGTNERLIPAIKKVHFNNPATVVIWTDGTKTIVRCGEGESYDPEKGLAMAIAKKALGNKGNYYEVFKKWLPETETASEQIATNSKELPGSLYTVKEYCEKHRLSRDKVYKMIKSGELKAEKESSGVWIIYE